MPFKTLTPKKLTIIGILALLVVNAASFGILYWISDNPVLSEAELVDLKNDKATASLETIYAELEPLPEFKSRRHYLRSIGEAVVLCEERLHSAVTLHKSWQVNMLQSRHVVSEELYRIFMDYQTAASLEQPSQVYRVICEVSEEQRKVVTWKVDEHDAT